MQSAGDATDISRQQTERSLLSHSAKNDKQKSFASFAELLSIGLGPQKRIIGSNWSKVVTGWTCFQWPNQQ